MENRQFKDLVLYGINKLEVQGEPSVNSQGKCFYQRDSLCCIVGHMMPSKEIRTSADSQGVSDIHGLKQHEFKWTQQFSNEQIYVLSHLQTIHDDIGGDRYQGIPFSDAIEKMRDIYDELHEAY